MRYVYTTPEGDVVQGDSYAAVVRSMSISKLDKPHSQRSYRRAVAARIGQALGLHIASETDAVFVHSLVGAQILTEVRPPRTSS